MKRNFLDRHNPFFGVTIPETSGLVPVEPGIVLSGRTLSKWERSFSVSLFSLFLTLTESPLPVMPMDAAPPS